MTATPKKPRRTIGQCNKEIADLKQQNSQLQLQVSTLEQELVRRTNYAAEVDTELAKLREEFDQLPDQTPGVVMVQARMPRGVVALVDQLQKDLNLVSRTHVLIQGVQLLLQRETSLRTFLTRRVRGFLPSFLSQ